MCHNIYMEIERKFLVNKKFKKELLTGPTLNITQGYLMGISDPVLRVRIENDCGFLTVKKNVNLISREEFEVKIPLNEALKLMEKCIKPLIVKTRHIYTFEKSIWEIDFFHEEFDGLIMAEIEINHEKQKVQFPEWIGQEVTKDPNYYNINMVLNKYGGTK